SIGHYGDRVIGLALLIMRLSLGITVMMHGYRHIYGGGKIAGTAGWFESLGMKPGVMHAWLASLTELIAGGMLVLGLLTPVAAGAVMGTLLVALITNHWKNGFFIFNKGEGYEYVLMIVCMSLALGTIGAGRYSLDKSLKYPIAPGSRAGFLITAILGIGSALAIVGLFWRPEKTSTSN
ncbi:MAG TPA: DoxX family protein, partial [Acidimicrobiia bacterium]